MTNNTDNLAAIIKLLKDNNLSEICLEEKDSKIKICQQITVGNTGIVTRNDKHTQVVEEKKDNTTPTGTTIKSPMVGTIYLSPAPEADPFVSVGNSIKKGDILCLVEAMKMFNKIKAEKNGVIKKILVENEHPVEFGTPVFIIEEN